MEQALIHQSRGNFSLRTRVSYMGMFKRKELSLVYYDRHPKTSTNVDQVFKLKSFKVPTNFYLKQNLGQRPYTGKYLGEVVESFSPYPK